MKIGLLSQWYPPETGPATLPAVLGRALVARGHQVVVVTGFPNYPTGRLVDGYRIRRKSEDTTSDGLTVRRVALYPSHDRSPVRRFLNYMSFAASATVSGLSALRSVDAFWVYNSPATVGLPSAAATAAGGPPHLMHIMDLWPDSVLFGDLAGSQSYQRVEWVLRKWCDWTYRQASAIACISEGVAAELRARGVRADKIHHIPVWVDEECFYPRERDECLARELGVWDKFTLLYAGSLGSAQGLDSLLEACARVADLKDFHCLIAGSGVAEQRLRARAKALKLTNTSFLGRWPTSDMGRLMSVGHVHLVSLRDDPLSSMTMPSKLPAILASGRPVIMSGTGEAARVVEQSRAGWTLPPGDIDTFESVLRQAHADGPSGANARGMTARRYYEDRLALSTGVDAVERLLVDIVGGRS